MAEHEAREACHRDGLVSTTLASWTHLLSLVTLLATDVLLAIRVVASVDAVVSLDKSRLRELSMRGPHQGSKSFGGARN